MNRRRTLIVLLIAFGLVAGVIGDRAIYKSTNAQQVNSNLSDRWEYCVISAVNYDLERKIHYARICYFRSSGCHEVEIEGRSYLTPIMVIELSP